MFRNKVRRRTFGPEEDEIRGGWGKLYSEKAHSLFSSLNISMVIK
jgi:hypothetical protein